MKTGNISVPIFTPERRQEVLNLLSHHLEQDPKIAGVILVGSGAYGFMDEFSDVDLAIVIYEGHDLKQIVQEWKHKIINQLEMKILQHFEVEKSPENLLLGFLTEDFLELNIGFQDIHHIFAKRPQWKVVFDKTSSLIQIMEESWKQRQENRIERDTTLLKYLVEGDWHWIRGAVIALQRGMYWNVKSNLDRLRDSLITIVAMRADMKITYFLDSPQMSKEFRSSLSTTLIPQDPSDTKSMFTTVVNLTELYYEEANISANLYGISDFSYLEKRIKTYLALVEKRIFT